MIPTSHVALIAGAWAFYLFDASLLLYSDEVALTRSARGWRAVLGGDAMVGGRFLAFPALLRPGTLVFLDAWHPRDRSVAKRMGSLLRCLAPLRVLSWLQFALVLGVMPVGLLLQAHPHWMLALLVAVYATSMAMGAWIVMRRRALALHGRALASVLVDVLACPPFAINVVRRVTLKLPPPASVPTLLRRTMPPATGERVRARIEARLALSRVDISVESPP